jgi:stalled ribosome rescue protein Dom34
MDRPRRHVYRHAKDPTEEHHLPDDLVGFFRDVAEGLRDAERILVMGPSTAKLQLLRYLHEREHELERRVVGLETVDRPTDRQLVAFVIRYYKLGDVVR